MNKKIVETLMNIFGIIYYFFSLIASGIVLIKIFNHFNVSSRFVDYFIYFFCFAGHFTMFYTVLKDIEKFDKEKK